MQDTSQGPDITLSIVTLPFTLDTNRGEINTISQYDISMRYQQGVHDQELERSWKGGRLRHFNISRGAKIQGMHSLIIIILPPCL